MHPHNDQQQDWHDFEIDSAREIVTLLRAIGDKKQLVRMLIKGETDVCLTAVLEVDTERGTVVLDCPVNAEQSRRAGGAERIAFETTLDKIRILFSSSQLRSVTHEGRPALEMAIPETMIRLQRREFYRMATPVSLPVMVCIPLPPELGGGTAAFPLADISCGGIALFDQKLVLGNSIGSHFQGCVLDLPEIGSVTTALHIRNALDLTVLNNKTRHRLGCEFVDISRGNLNLIQRYITRLEREHNARVAGLG
ncbi:flagellar brake protein [Massilia glaciei]|uniref:Flagellar brake protein YcgR n=2 Tax=Massilia glaciei TaxID=1524097 RepID=A0A2U2HMY6_9BURK|nr:flagellar brake protein [Massilia glaciei]